MSSEQNPSTAKCSATSTATTTVSPKRLSTKDRGTGNDNDNGIGTHPNSLNPFPNDAPSDRVVINSERESKCDLPTSSSAHNSRIRRLQSSHVRPKPQVLTDFPPLSIPALQQRRHHSTGTWASFESRNDHENNFAMNNNLAADDSSLVPKATNANDNDNDEPAVLPSTITDSIKENALAEEAAEQIVIEAERIFLEARRLSLATSDQQAVSEGFCRTDETLGVPRNAVSSEEMASSNSDSDPESSKQTLGSQGDGENGEIDESSSTSSSSLSTILREYTADYTDGDSSKNETERSEDDSAQNGASGVDTIDVDNFAGMPQDEFDDEITNNNPSLRSVASRVASIEDFQEAIETCLPSRLKDMNLDNGGNPLPQDKILSRLDGILPDSALLARKRDKFDQSIPFEDDANSPIATEDGLATVVVTDDGIEQIPIKPLKIESKEAAAEQRLDDENSVGSWFTSFMGSMSRDENDFDSERPSSTCNDSISSTSPALSSYPRASSGSNNALVKVSVDVVDGQNHQQRPPSFPRAFRASQKISHKLSNWVDNKFTTPGDLPKDGTYSVGESKTVVVHEIMRGSWTWCTAWSPDGNQLAIATENHDLAVVDTTLSPVWRVKHDKVVRRPPKQGTTQSIRSIAWGEHFIAIGGTGNAVSILAPTEPYQILHTIPSTGFVGSLDWLRGSNKLLVGSRNGRATVHEIWENLDTQNTMQNFDFPGSQSVCQIKSKVIHTINRGKPWVNAVQFKPGDTFFAVGDSHGILLVYRFDDAVMMELINVANFKLEDSILTIQWSTDGKYLYAGGEDFEITVINTERWEPVHKIKRDRWVQFISSSQGSTHLAVGGVTSEVSILDVQKGWDNIINIGLKGFVPLSANWHPDDQYLVLTGQNDRILAVETTNGRHVSGHFLRSVYPVASVAFSPDGHQVAIGNEMGVVGIFILSGTTFVSAYELVVDCSNSLSIEWSPNGSYVVIAAVNKVIIVARKETLVGSVPLNTSGFFVAKVIRDLGCVNDISIDSTSRFIAVSGSRTRVVDADSNFENVLEIDYGGTTLANAWSHDGKWFAAIGKDHNLVIYDTSDAFLSQWRSVFTVETKGAGLALAWGKSSSGGLQYCAYGGEDKQIHIMEIRTKERSWETVLTIPRDGEIFGLDWNSGGLVAAAISNGTVTVLDLSYLQSGCAVNEMDYNWQRQALTCYTEIRRNKGKHSMKCVRWIPSATESEDFLATGGTDGEVEIVDLSKRDECRGFQSMAS